MKGSEAQRDKVLEQVAKYLLENGIQGATLRPLAKAAGTSDRMLLYYFEDKDALIAAGLQRIAADVAALLEGMQSEPQPFEVLLPQLTAVMQSDAMQPYMRIWFEAATLAGHGNTNIGDVGRQIGDRFHAWIANALQVEREEERLPKAALLLVLIDGMGLFHSVGNPAIAEAALRAALEQ